MNWSNERNLELQTRARQVIPGGMYGHQSVRRLPDGFPQFFSRAEGCRLWDADGNEYVDMMCAYGPMLLGYQHPKVEAAASEQGRLGDTMTGPSEIMVDLAERFVARIEHADWAVFSKNGTDATSGAIAIARATTGRRTILLAEGAYHGAAPWCTPFPTGTLEEARAHQIEFCYGDPESLDTAIRRAGDDLAGILVSPFRHDAAHDQTEPDAAFAREVRDRCTECEALLILDEVRAGLRLSFGGSWESLGVKPDLSAWGKSIANGHALSALVGNERCREAASKVYMTGSFWFQAVPMAAALATFDELSREPYVEHVVEMGTRLRDGWREQAARHGVGIRQTGPVQMPMVLFDGDSHFRKAYRWTSEALRRGAYLHPWHNMFLSTAHQESDVDRVLEATEEAFAAIANFDPSA
ncbi:MAG: aminotransferase class III-fold pyridoxal phosphate-dependent enzyme [bacterium]|nr:aminotransferase class III-fold pyridoxal phosphate-dependent enzyme [bacterium]